VILQKTVKRAVRRAGRQAQGGAIGVAPASEKSMTPDPVLWQDHAAGAQGCIAQPCAPVKGDEMKK